MFGYVRPDKNELLVREYDAYKAVYCTLCRELGKHYNIFTRMVLSYDVTFYTMIALDFSGAAPKVRKGRCVVNPLKKCNFICEGEEAYHKGAALTVIMAYHKVMDNIHDEGFFKSLAARLTRPFLAGAAKKAAKEYPLMGKALEEMMAAQAQVELAPDSSLDACCDPTAKALSVILAELAGGDEAKQLVLSQLGYFLGRWVYTMDAADDLKEDMKEGGFNPLIRRLGLTGTEIPPDKQSKVDEECNRILNHNVAQLVPAVHLLDLGRYGSIVENVIEKGLPEVQREILFLHIRDKDRTNLKK